MTRARPRSKWSIDGHVHALARDPAGGKLSGMMCACMSTIIDALSISGDRALKSRLPPHEQCAAILGHEARAVNRDLRTRSIAPAASQLWAALRPAGPKATPGASARTTTE